MNNVLVVEDEKMIRRGIVTMLKRIPVPTEEVFEARNGEEALKILKEVEIDLMITDIRMPKMDGITLVKQVQTLCNRPQILVVSGYDDFNYAVEVLRQGVKDYLLKPIEREKFAAAVLGIQKDLDKKQEEKEMSQKIGSQQLKYLILNQNIRQDEIEAIEARFENLYPSSQYRVCCMCEVKENFACDEHMIVLRNVNGQSLVVTTDEDLDNLSKKDRLKGSMGISGIHKGIEELSKAYEEALYARKEAFVKRLSFYYYEETDASYEMIPADFAEQFVQLLGTHRVEDGLHKFSNIRFKARMNKISAEMVLQLTQDIMDRIIENYARVMEFDMEQFHTLRDPLLYENEEDYYEKLEQWIRKIQTKIMEEFEDYKNKEKINRAVRFIQENYKSDLNMAVVSNTISMNYSLFSLNFKEYTGMNFVNYLKKIRIDEAKRLLEETDEKIIDISQMVGYENEKHFMKIFKNKCGVSPSEYRKNSQFQKK